MIALYSYWRSSSSWRVRIALALKGIDYEYRPVHLLKDGGEQRKPEFRALNPAGLIPLLEVSEGGTVRHLGQSMAILEFLEERYPTPPLLPADPFARAKVRELSELVVSGIQPLQNLSVQRKVKHLGADEKAWARDYNLQGLTTLEAMAAKTAGRYLVGDQVTYADLCLIPQLYSARRLEVDLSLLPTLTRVEAECEKLPAFQLAHADRQPDTQPA